MPAASHPAAVDRCLRRRCCCCCCDLMAEVTFVSLEVIEITWSIGVTFDARQTQSKERRERCEITRLIYSWQWRSSFISLQNAGFIVSHAITTRRISDDEGEWFHLFASFLSLTLTQETFHHPSSSRLLQRLVFIYIISRVEQVSVWPGK